MDPNRYYRYDIQGLRAIAVVSVIVFHSGFLPNGYLGVDVFLVISGFLITKIIYDNFKQDKYSIKVFYERRFRRIIPLVLLTGMVALVLGLIFMLPDDLENLSQSIIATNFFSNNILQYMTTRDYWDVGNDYKPMLHTWSLGIEEQFYLAFPFLFVILKSNKKYIFSTLLVITVISFLYFIFNSNQAFKFYMLPTRFFEISIGGLAALKMDKIIGNRWISGLSFFMLIFILVVELQLPNELEVIIVVICSVLLIAFNHPSSFVNKVLKNKMMVYIGAISFSLYMWHQVILAFFRYTITQKIGIVNFMLILGTTFLLSIISYHGVERYFRSKQNVSINTLLKFCVALFALINITCFVIYLKAGIIRDVPELGITTKDTKRGIHAKYNARIYDMDRNFKDTGKTKVLIIGHSFARDFANIILESRYADGVEISYSADPYKSKNMQAKTSKADIIFLSEYDKQSFISLKSQFNIDARKVWVIGTKRFGSNNGVVYNNRSPDYCNQRVEVDNQTLILNKQLANEWGSRYINLLSSILDNNGKVAVFTSDCKFISQDTRHLTRSGAKMFAGLLNLEKYLKVPHVISAP